MYAATHCFFMIHKERLEGRQAGDGLDEISGEIRAPSRVGFRKTEVITLEILSNFSFPGSLSRSIKLNVTSGCMSARASISLFRDSVLRKMELRGAPECPSSRYGFRLTGHCAKWKWMGL